MQLPSISRRLLTLALAPGALACATAPAGSARPERVESVTVESEIGRRDYKLRPDVSGFRTPFELPASQVWAALPTAYRVLPIPVDGLDSARHFISGSALTHRQFLRRPVSRFVDCGSTIVGPNADSYNVRLRIQSKVDSITSTTSSLHTWLDATGSSSVGTAIRCTSSGELEGLVKDQVKELLRDTN